MVLVLIIGGTIVGTGVLSYLAFKLGRIIKARELKKQGLQAVPIKDHEESEDD